MKPISSICQIGLTFFVVIRGLEKKGHILEESFHWRHLLCKPEDLSSNPRIPIKAPANSIGLSSDLSMCALWWVHDAPPPPHTIIKYKSKGRPGEEEVRQWGYLYALKWEAGQGGGVQLSSRVFTSFAWDLGVWSPTWVFYTLWDRVSLYSPVRKVRREGGRSHLIWGWGHS